eukprot:995141-Pyramimonas_sp.AAC.1
MSLMRECMPQSSVSFRPSHPRLTEECVQLVEEKRRASGTDFFPLACRRCSDALLSAHEASVQRTRLRLRNMRRGSKQWW